MSVRRWIGSTGVVVALAAGTLATARVAAGDRFEAQASLLMEGPRVRDMPAQLLNERVRFLDSPEVRGLVRSRLGETPTVRATVGTDDTLLVRSRATTPWRAAEVAKTYAESYVDVRRRQAEAELAAVSNEVRRKADQIRSQLESANEPERTSLVEQLGLFNTRLDQLQPGDHGPGVVGVTPAEPVDDGSRRAWLVAALGAIVGAGAAVSARRAARRDHAVT